MCTARATENTSKDKVRKGFCSYHARNFGLQKMEIWIYLYIVSIRT